MGEGGGESKMGVYVEQDCCECKVRKPITHFRLNIAGSYELKCEECKIAGRHPKKKASSSPKPAKMAKGKSRSANEWRRSKLTFKKAYHKYLETEGWKATRLEALALADNKCAKCETALCLHVHHLTYERVGNELMTDLQVLCGTCHAREHGLIA